MDTAEHALGHGSLVNSGKAERNDGRESSNENITGKLPKT